MSPQKKIPAKTPTKAPGPELRTDHQVMAALNEVESADELITALKLPKSQAPAAEALLARRAMLQRGAFTETAQLHDAFIAGIGSAALIDAVRKLALPVERGVPTERLQFNQLVIQNPNYFGNLEESIFKPVKPIKGNTTYESLDCVGLNPPFDRLEAVINVKSAFGYGGDVCTNGSREFVRFYVDIDDNGTWIDVGFSQVRVYNVPGPKPICYAVSQVFDPSLKLCFAENIVKVRAILSWNSIPPANTPGFIPVWGERTDVEVQIRPRKFIIIDDFIDLLPAKDPLVPVLQELTVDSLAGVIPTPPITLADKKALYKSAKVPVGRYAFTEVLELAKSDGLTAFSSPNAITLEHLGLGKAELADLFKDFAIVPVDGNTSYEELECVGYDPGKKLVQAVLHVKNALGYSGSLCKNGSTEYVGFYADFGAGYEHLGTATVNVHDLATLPAGGVHYAVDLKVDLSEYEIPCTSGARTPRLRAILSWQTPPTGPTYVPRWGNREDCRIHIRPGAAVAHVPLIESVGDIAVQDIDQTTGLATGPFVIAGATANQSPFGAKVTLTGRIGAPPDAFGGPQAEFRYRVRARKTDGSPWETLTNNVLVNISEWLNGVPQQCEPGEFVCSTTLSTTDDGDGHGDGWYTYLEDTIAPWTRALVQDKLAEWHTGDREGLWRIELTAKDGNGDILGSDFTNVMLDNHAPSVPLLGPADDEDADILFAITGFTFNGVLNPATECDHIPVGSTIRGTYEVRDPGVNHTGQHMGSLNIGVIPGGPANGASVVIDPNGPALPPAPAVPPASTSSRLFPALPTDGEKGTWTLDTTPMVACGYVVRLTAYDRTIVNSSYVGRRRSKDLGFCLVPAPK